MPCDVDAIRIVFEIAQRDDQVVFESLNALEDAIVEMLLTQFVPEVFLGIEFGRVRRKKQQAKVIGQAQIVAPVPPGTIEYHHDVVVGVAAGDFVEEDLHATGVDMRQHQTVEAAILRTYRAIGVGVLLCHHGGDQRPRWSPAPAVACVADASKPGFVLEHQP